MTIPEGWVLAPCEATEEMLVAANRAAEEWEVLMSDVRFAAARAFYRAMLASAPPAPGGDDETIHQGRELNRLLAAGASPAPEGFSSDVASDGLHRVALGRHIGWKPIESAPKDRTAFLAVTANGDMMVWCGDLLATALENRPYHLTFQATHWMPLPDSPAEGLGTDGGETAKRREEPLTPSPSLADKGLVEEARGAVAFLRNESSTPPRGSYAYLFERLANALEARAARALSGGPGE